MFGPGRYHVLVVDVVTHVAPILHRDWQEKVEQSLAVIGDERAQQNPGAITQCNNLAKIRSSLVTIGRIPTIPNPLIFWDDQNFIQIHTNLRPGSG